MKPFLTGETTSTRETRHEEIATLPLGRNYRFLARKRDSTAGRARSRSLAPAALARTAVLAVLVRWLRSLAPPCWPRSLKPPAPRLRAVLAHPCTRPSMARKKAKKLT
jgi:hypothetical protein